MHHIRALCKALSKALVLKTRIIICLVHIKCLYYEQIWITVNLFISKVRCTIKLFLCVIVWNANYVLQRVSAGRNAPGVQFMRDIIFNKHWLPGQLRQVIVLIAYISNQLLKVAHKSKRPDKSLSLSNYCSRVSTCFCFRHNWWVEM